MHINVNIKTVEKWDQLKCKGNFANDEAFLSHLLDHYETCPLLIPCELKLEPPELASTIDEGYNSEMLTPNADIERVQDTISFCRFSPANYNDVGCVSDQKETADALEHDIGFSKCVQIGEVTISPVEEYSFSPLSDCFVYRCRKFTNPKVVLRRLNFSDIVKYHSSSVEPRLSPAKMVATFGKKTCFRELGLNVKKRRKTTRPFKQNIVMVNGVLKAKRWDVPTLGENGFKQRFSHTHTSVKTEVENACFDEASAVGKSSLVDHVSAQNVNSEDLLISEKNQLPMKFKRDGPLRIRSDLRRTLCEICGTMTPFVKLATHIKNHFNPSKLPCDKCGKLYYDQRTLNRHKATLHRTKDSPVYLCSHCPKIFSSTGTLDSHVKFVHLKMFNYECDICHSRFVRLQYLREHKYIHTGEKPLKCELCNQNFRQSGTFSKHMIGVHGIRKKYNTMIIKQLDGSGGKNNENMDQISTSM